MDNKEKFAIGTQFVGNANGVKCEVVKFVPDRNGKPLLVVLKDLKTDKTFTYGLRALEKCDITLIKEGK